MHIDAVRQGLKVLVDDDLLEQAEMLGKLPDGRSSGRFEVERFCFY
jgi:hypothetical protein